MSTLKPRHDAHAAVAPYLTALEEQRSRFSRESEDWHNVDMQIEALLGARDRLQWAFRDAGRCLVLGGGFDVSLRH